MKERGKSSNKKGGEGSYGKGKVTPLQIAYLVDRYLSDQNYPKTRSVFRNEASHFFNKTPLQHAPKTLLSLAAILDEYINLKEQKVLLDQEKSRMQLEKDRVQTLLLGMQNAMNAYNFAGNGQIPLQPTVVPSLGSSLTAKSTPPSLGSSLTQNSAAVAPQINPTKGSPAGYYMYSTPQMMTASMLCNNHIDRSNLSTPATNVSAAKRRKDSKDAPVNAKRTRNSSNIQQLPTKGTNNLSQLTNQANNQENPQHPPVGRLSPNDSALKNTALVQGSSIAKCLFNKPTPSPPTNMSIPETPIRASSSQTNKSVSSLQTSSTSNSGDNVTPHKTTSTDRIVISSETIRVSPEKQLTYYSVERNHCISSSSPINTNLRLNKRDHVKGRLNFDDSTLDAWVSNEISVPESDKERDIYDFDLAGLDALGVDFSLSDLLGDDFDPDGHFSVQPEVDSSPGSHLGSPADTWNAEKGTAQVFTQMSSSVTEIFSEKDMNLQALLSLKPVQHSLTSVRSRTKSLNFTSPVKNQRSSYLDQENKEVVN